MQIVMMGRKNSKHDVEIVGPGPMWVNYRPRPSTVVEVRNVTWAFQPNI